MEPSCRKCTHFTSPAAFNPRTLGSRYKSPVTRRREYCEPGRCNARIGTDLKYGFNPHSYNVNRVVNKIQELNRNVQDFDRRRDLTNEAEQKNSSELSLHAKINDLKDAHNIVMTCIREMEKIKIFLEEENSWWKILKGRAVNCCQQKLPHLHGVLDGSLVTLMLLEEDTDETSTANEKNDANSVLKLDTSSSELANEVKPTEQYTNSQIKCMEGYVDPYTIANYSLDTKSGLIEITSIERHNPTPRYVKKTVRSEQSIVSEVWEEAQEDRNDEQQTQERSRSKKTPNKMYYDEREKKTDKSNVVPSKEIYYGQDIQTTFEDASKPRETFSSENTASKKHVDFESNVDLNTELPSRNVAGHKPRTETIIEKGIRHIQNLPAKISKIKSRD